jgi:membrane protein DedA with SNARE-associated domain
MSLEELLASYGYVVLLLGTFLEGETVLVIAGFLAHRGYLELWLVIAVAFLGTFLGDQLFFYIGRLKGGDVLDRRPAWKAKSSRVLALLKQHQLWLILGFRFLYGLRTVTPFLIGLSGVAPFRFFLLNGIGALAWAIVVGVLGYFLGHAVEVVLGEVKRYELWIIALVALLGACIWLAQWFKRKRRGAPDTPVTPTR